jgi:hypothetical protein
MDWAVRTGKKAIMFRFSSAFGVAGCSAAARSFAEDAVRLAVIAHIRHAETTYDELLAAGCDRHHARAQVDQRVCEVLAGWEGHST